MTTNVQGHYAPVNGLRMYYEIHGAGRPLVLLHGGLGTIAGLFDQLLPPLAETRQVVAVELQGHGHTNDIDRPFSFEQFADDVAALIKHLGIERADVLGYSLGGGVALQAAIRHPEVVRRLVVVSAPFSRNGWYPESLAGMAAIDAEALAGTIVHEAYLRAAPRPEDWPRLIEKSRTLLAQDYDWSTSVAEIEAPALIVVGDADGLPLAHAVEMYSLFGRGQSSVGIGRTTDSQLAVLPGTTHLDILTRVDLLLPILSRFLDARDPDTT